MKYIAPKAELVLLETELIMDTLWSSGDMLPDDDDASAAPAARDVDWD